MKILCPVDGSDFSRLLMQGVGTVFRNRVKEIVLLHVLPAGHSGKGRIAKNSQAASSPALSEKMARASNKLLHGHAERLKVALNQAGTSRDISLTTMVMKGDVSEAILRASEKMDADCIAVGSRGMSDVPGYLLGSVSRKVVTHASCSVLMVKGALTGSLPVVLALDGSKATNRAIRKIITWLNPDEVTLHAVSVVPERLTDLGLEMLGKRQAKAFMAPVRKQTQVLLADARKKFLKAGFQVDTELLEGNPRTQIVEATQRLKAQLVCVGSKGLSGIERFTLGSVSEWVSTYSPVSVLVMR
ncbi:MAG: universal stress protein [Nitrospirales bacterium]|nr:MAG: universal stress protein [Nitrospirales bacterium]